MGHKSPSSYQTILGVAASVLLWLCAGASAETLNVPSTYPTIQTAIDAASDGDTVAIADGVYSGVGNQNLDFAGKQITVQSVSGNPELCVIDCADNGRGFYFHSQEMNTSVVQALTIANGHPNYNSPGGPDGGAILCLDNSNPTIIACHLIGNAAVNGGGIMAGSSAPVITHCRVSSNSASHGGGVYTDNYSSAGISNCLIDANHAYGNGAGIYCAALSDPLLTNCTIVAGVGDSVAGGIYCQIYSSPIVTNSIVWGNTPEAIVTDSSTLQVTYCDIEGGWAGTGNIDSDPLFINQSDYHLTPESPCVDAGTNTPIGDLSPIDLDGIARPLDGDGDTIATADIGVYEYNTSVPALAASPVAIRFSAPVGGPSPAGQALTLRNVGSGEIDWEITGLPLWLSATPNSGTVDSVPLEVVLTVDVAGLFHGSYSTELEVRDTATGVTKIVNIQLNVQDQLLVPTEYTTIQAAIDASIDGDEIILADQTYTGSGNINLDFNGREITIRGTSGIAERCTIDCQNSGRGFYFHSGEQRLSVVSGLRIQNGQASSATPDGAHGGGVLCTNGSNPTLTNCIIMDCSASDGGGISCYGSDPRLVNCILSNNAAQSGGAAYCTSASNLEMIHCTVTANQSDTGGALFHGNSCVAIITNSILWNNKPDQIYTTVNEPAVTYSDIQNGWPGNGNIDADPRFAFPSYLYLTQSSPCIDAGTNVLTGGLPLTDIDGNPRLSDGDGNGTLVADMGVRERDLAKSTIALSPVDFLFAALENEADPNSQKLTLMNVGGVPLNWEITGQPGWLTVSPSNGVLAADEHEEITLSAAGSGLTRGTHQAVLQVADPNANNSPRQYLVTFLVGYRRQVPTEFPTIQAAINAAVDYDVIELADGAYTGAGNRDLEFGGKNLVVRGKTNDPNLVIIDCETQGRGFYFHTGEDERSVIENLTIRNGNVIGRSDHDDEGGGIRCVKSHPTLRNLVFTNCTANYGGGLSCRTTNAVITQCLFRDNLAEESGGGIHLTGWTPRLADCRILGNRAHQAGAGLASFGSHFIAERCQITDNLSRYQGGGVFSNSDHDAVLQQCIISDNQGGTGRYFSVGGGVYTYYSDLAIIDCVLERNIAPHDDDSRGGAIYAVYGNPYVERCRIANNTADEGGGVGCKNSALTLNNCLIIENTARYFGGGLRCYNTGSLYAQNCTFANNYAATYYGDETSNPVFVNTIFSGAIAGELKPNDGNPTLLYCALPGGWNGAGNLDTDPSFAFDHDYHLSLNSPCIDAGDDAPSLPLTAVDGEGNPRVVDGDGDQLARVDIGALEFDPNAFTIALDSKLVHFHCPAGSSPAPVTIALRNCGSRAMKWELQGSSNWPSYEPSSGTSSGEINEVLITMNAAALAAGSYATTLTLVAPGANNTPQQIQVQLDVGKVHNVPEDYATIQAALNAAQDYDFVELADGVYTGDGNNWLDFKGKAITLRSHSRDPRRCIIDGENESVGFYISQGEDMNTVIEDLTITNCRSTSTNVGGAISCYRADPAIRNCIIENNRSTFDAAGFYLYDSRALISDCIIRANHSDARASGFYCNHGAPIFTNCTIVDNTSDNKSGYGEGGILNSEASYPSIVNCTIANNTAKSYTGGIYCRGGETTVRNTILWNNQPAEIYIKSGQLIVSNSDITGGWAGDGNINAEPRFANPGDYHLLAGSPCIDTGSNQSISGFLTKDIDGNPRSLDGDGDGAATIDIGSDEYCHNHPVAIVSPQQFDFYAWEGQTDPPTQTLTLDNGGEGVFNWRVVRKPDWLTTLPSNGSITDREQDVTISVQTAGLPRGIYTGAIEIVDPNADNTPVVVSVTLRKNGDNLVPSEYTTIQAAIDASLAGDTVVIADGVYTDIGNKNLDFGGKELTVRSASGDPKRCVIDCEGEGHGFIFHSQEAADSVVDGLSIINGSRETGATEEQRGGAILCTAQSNPSIRNCIFRLNRATDGGALACVDGSQPTVTQCQFFDNYARFRGGAFFCDDSSPTITDCLIRDNLSNVNGGGLYSEESSPVISRCTFLNNAAVGTTLGGNQPDAYGGGIYLYRGTPLLSHSKLIGNSVSGDTANGGGIYCSQSNLIATNCVLAQNTSERYGAGLYSYRSDPELINCTFSRNIALVEGGAIYTYLDPTPKITNSILWGDSPNEIFRFDSSSPTVAYSNVQGGWPGEGNLEVDPEFVLSGDYHLTADSLCIDIGVNDPNLPTPNDDLDGITRPLDGDLSVPALIDMGAYEFDPLTPQLAYFPLQAHFHILADTPQNAEQTLHIRNGSAGQMDWSLTHLPPWLMASATSGVSSGELDEVILTTDASGLLPGTYTATLQLNAPQTMNAPAEITVVLEVNRLHQVPIDYATIQAAIDAAEPGDVVEIADGVYTGAGNRDLDLHGKSIIVRGDSNDPNTCILDCENSGRGFTFDDREQSDTVIAGLTIINGNAADNTSYSGSGGALLFTNASRPTIRNCRLVHNTAITGGAVLLTTESNPLFERCDFIENSATASGGAIYLVNGCDPTVNGCRFLGNSALAPRSGEGGAIHCRSSASIRIANSVFVGNHAMHYGGAIATTSLLIAISNCTIIQNTAESGGGIWNSYSHRCVLTNSIMRDNFPNDLDYNSGYQPNISYSNVSNKWTGGGNIDINPLFVRYPNPGPDGLWDGVDDDYGDLRLRRGSPCIDAGDNSSLFMDFEDLDADGVLIEPQPFDLSRLARRYDVAKVRDTGYGESPLVDIGAYEYHGLADGDVDGNGRIDTVDFYMLIDCMGGPTLHLSEACQAYDSDFDHDIDMHDGVMLQLNIIDPGEFREMDACWTGPHHLRNLGCRSADFDTDSDVDTGDFSTLQISISNSPTASTN